MTALGNRTARLWLESTVRKTPLPLGDRASGWSSPNWSAAAAEQARLPAMVEKEREDTELRKRSLTYVAATRARDELAVVRRA